jgi:hypothetical protein
MHQVGIVFKNGSNTTFEAQEFNIDIAKDSSGGIRYNDVKVQRREQVLVQGCAGQ